MSGYYLVHKVSGKILVLAAAMLTVLLMLACSGGDQASLDEYLEICREIESGALDSGESNFLEGLSVTLEDATEQLESVEPPAEVAAWHDAVLAYQLAVKESIGDYTEAGEGQSEDEYIFNTLFPLASEYGPAIDAAISDMDADVRERMITAGCLGDEETDSEDAGMDTPLPMVTPVTTAIPNPTGSPVTTAIANPTRIPSPTASPTATLVPLPPVPTPRPPATPLPSGDPSLYRAIWAGSLDDLREQTALGKEVNASNEQGDPFLYTAVWRGGPDKVQALIDAGADVDVRDSDNDPVLYTAIWRGQTEALRILVDAGADVDARDSDNDPLLYTAVWRGETEALRILVGAGADVDARDSDNDPLLYTAVWRGETEALRILVDAGADVNARRANGQSLLYVANWRGHTDIEQILVDAGATE